MPPKQTLLNVSKINPGVIQMLNVQGKRIWNRSIILALCASGSLVTHAQTSPVNPPWSTGPAIVTEYLTPSQASLPQGIDIDAQGNIWYAETSAGKVAVLRPNQTAAEYPLPGKGQPFTVKVGSDGIWFTDSGNEAIGNLNPATGQIQEFAIPSGSEPLFLQIASDGSKWFSEVAGVGRLAPNGVTSEWPIALEHPDDNIEQLSIDPFGNIWFAERNFDGVGAAGTNDVRRLNPLTNVISTYLVPTFGGNPAGIQANSDGTIWVSEYFANAFALLFPGLAPHTNAVELPNSHAGVHSSAPSPIDRLGRQNNVQTPETPAVNFTQPRFTLGWIEYVIPAANTEAEDMRVDQFGRLWYEGDTGFLGVLNPFIAVFNQYNVPSQNSGYYNIVLDENTGKLWFAEAGAFGPVPTKIGNLKTGDI
jgi:virginiamycin B lyase